MALAGVDDSGRYLDVLRRDSGELDLLAMDLLINVTSFFRDPTAFELLAEEAIPDLVHRQPSELCIRKERPPLTWASRECR
jgi:two-component system CheB/CheR fusion protein